MKVSTKTRYGLRTMVALGERYPNQTAQLHELAEQEDISVKYLSQILITLRNAKYISSQRGSQGGYRINKNPSEINVAEIVELFEGSFYPIDCVDCPENCDKSSKCVTRPIWKLMGDTLMQTLSAITIQHLVENKTKNELHYYI